MGTWDWDLVTGRVIWSPRMEAIAVLEPGTDRYLGVLTPSSLHAALRRSVDEES